jgi:excisionase family DNA binding protein
MSKPAPIAKTPARFGSVDAGAELASCSPRTIRRRIADGSLTGYRFGPRLIRVDLNEVAELLCPIPTTRAS